jgi:hypothetical protein
MDKAVVVLSEAIEALRAELTKAIAEGADREMQFALDPIELTVQAVVTKGANGRIGWKVLELGGSVEAASTQTLTLKLTPVWKAAHGTLTRDFTIASAATPADVTRPHS